MTIDRPFGAPGCFGTISGFKDDDDICTACEFFGACQVKHDLVITQFREFYGIKNSKRTVASLPDKVRQMLEELGKTPEEVRNAIQSNQNPFMLHAGFVGIVAHIILKTQFIGVSRKDLEKAMLMLRKVNEKTAAFYVRQALHILRHCEAITETNGKIFVNHGIDK